MHIIISGINGFIGSRLRIAMMEMGWEVNHLSREDFTLGPDPLGQKISGADVIIHLSGAPIVRRWTEKYKKTLRSSRIETTHALVDAISLASEKPRLFISTSAIGIYAPEGVHSEMSYNPAGDFMGQLCRDWESEANVASSYTRTVIFRLGIVLAKDGGALPKMILPFKFWLGAKIGNGKQGFSWIHIQDLISAYLFVIENTGVNGTFNLTSPEPCDNAVFTQTVSSFLNRPAVLSVPVFILKLMYGEGSTAVTGGQRVVPERLLNSGFNFRFPTLESALSDILR